MTAACKVGKVVLYFNHLHIFKGSSGFRFSIRDTLALHNNNARLLTNQSSWIVLELEEVGLWQTR